MNMSIKCQVTGCKYNESNEGYCTLNKIEVVTNSLVDEADKMTTDCGSFEPRD